MSTEVGSLELVIESEAKQANRSLTGLINRLEKVETSLTRVMTIAQGGVSLKGINFDKVFNASKLEKAGKQAGEKYGKALIKNFNLGRAGKDIEKQAAELSNKMFVGLAKAKKGNSIEFSSESGREAEEALTSLCTLIERNGSVAKGVADEYRELYECIKAASKIQISTDTAKSLGDSFSQRKGVLKNIKATDSVDSGRGLDSFLGGNIPDSVINSVDGLREALDGGSIEEQFMALSRAINKYYEDYRMFEPTSEADIDGICENFMDYAREIADADESLGGFQNTLSHCSETGKSFSESLGFDTSSFDRTAETAKQISSTFNEIGKTKVSSGTENLKKETRSLQEQMDSLLDRFEDVGKDFDTSSVSNLAMETKKTERELTRLKQSLAKNLATTESETLGKSFVNTAYDIQFATNKLEALKKAKSATNDNITIERWGNTGGATSDSDASVVNQSLNNTKTEATETVSVFGRLSAMLAALKGISLGDIFHLPSSALEFFKLDSTRLMDSTFTNDDALTEVTAKIESIKGAMSSARSSVGKSLSIGDVKGADEGLAKIRALERELKQYEKIAKGITSEKVDAGSSIDTSTISGKLKSFGASVKNAFSQAGAYIANSKLGSIGSIVGKGVVGAVKGVKTFGKGLKTVGSMALQAFPGIAKLGSGISSLGKRLLTSGIRQLVFKIISGINTAIQQGVQYLAQYSGSFNNAMSSMTSSLGYVRNALTSAFAPIVEVVAPYISQLLDMVASAANTLGRFFSALTGKSYAVQGKKAWTDYGSSVASAGTTASDGLDKATESAQEFQDYTLGIDELNVQPNSDSGSSGSSGSGSGGTGSGSGTGTNVADMFETTSIESSISDFANQLRSAFQSQNWEELGTLLGEKVNSIVDSIDFAGFGAKLGSGLNGAIQTVYYFLNAVDFVNIGSKIAEFLNNALTNIDFTFVGRLFIKQFTMIFDLVGGFLGSLDWGEVARDISDFLIGAMNEASDWIQGVDWANVARKLVKAIKDFILGIKWTELVISAFRLVGAAIGAVASFGGQLIKDALGALGDWIGDAFDDLGKNGIDGFLEGIVDAIAGIGQWIVDNVFQPFIDGFKGAFEIHSPSKVMAEMGGYVMEGLLEGIKGFGSSVLEFFSGIWENIKLVFSPVITWFSENFGGAIEGIKEAWSDIKDWFSEKWEGIKEIFSPVATWFSENFGSAYTAITNAWSFIGTWAKDKWNSIKKPFSNVAGYFREAFQNAYNAVTKIWDGIKGYFKTIAKNIIKPIGKAVNGVINGINWVLEKVGSGTRVKTWNYQSTLDTISAFKNGTGGLTEDTLGLVNDQAGGTYKELIVPPNGKPFIPQGRNVMLPLTKGTKIMPANETKAFLDNPQNSFPHFASGVGDFFNGAWKSIKNFTGNIADFLDKPRDILEMAVDKFTDVTGWDGIYADMASSAVKKLVDNCVNYIKKFFDSASSSKVEKAVKWAIGIANDNSHGYDQANRWGTPDYDCSSLVISAFEQAGIPLKSSGATYTGNMYSVAKNIGFSDVTGSVNKSSGSGIKRGDILLNRKNHTALSIGDGRVVQASSNENRGITGGKAGDQTGREIWTTSYYNFPWDDVLRYSKFAQGVGKILAKDVFPRYELGGFPEDGLFMANHNELIGQFANGKTAVANNYQIQDGIEKAVYNGYMKAHNEDSTETSLLTQILDAVKAGKTISIDGREIVRVYDTRKARNGYSFT